MLLDIAQDGKGLILFILDRILPVNAVCIIEQMQKQKSHGGLIHVALQALLVKQRPDQIFNQVLNRQNISHHKVQIVGRSGVSAQGIDEKILNNVVTLHHGESGIKKFRQDNKIYGDIILTGGEDFLPGVAVQKQQIACFQDNGAGTVDDVRSGAAAHINDFDKIVLVSRKMGKARMRTDADQLAVLQHFFAVYNKFPAGGIQFPADIGLPVKDCLFFFGNGTQLHKQFRMHADSFLRGTRLEDECKRRIAKKKKRYFFQHSTSHLKLQIRTVICSNKDLTFYSVIRYNEISIKEKGRFFMEKYYLAIDIGASSGRHILGSVQDGKMQLEEIYRFPNGMTKKDGHRCWDVQRLFREILTGMKKCAELGKIPESVGVDTWGVDFVLLDEQDHMIGDAVGYRDSRTAGMDEEVYKEVPLEELYHRTGIQKAIFNTVYQFMALKKQQPEYLQRAKTFLMIPDYFHFLLSGVKTVEYTNASTTQLLNPETFDWDRELMRRLGYPEEIFPEIAKPGTVLGNLKPEIAKEVGYSCKVVLPATHDTGSAVLAVPAEDDDFLYISSGTWSLMGIERRSADCSDASMAHNFTNEGGYERRFRYLKNIMGLWMIQSVKKELNDAYSFAELCTLASQADFPSRVDVNDEAFLAPDSMIQAVKDMCAKNGDPVPQTPGEIASCIYQSLAESYGCTVREIEELTGRTYSRIHIVGGGSNADYLNQLTAQATGKEVYAGPGEATAIGNLAAQMLQDGVYGSVEEVRRAIGASFAMKKI